VCTALVIESDESTASFLCDQLAADGIDARLARTAQHALALADQSPPALIVLGDLEGRRDSLELLSSVRAGTASPASLSCDISVVMITGLCAELDVLRAFEAGADDVIAKPFSYAEVRARLRAVMRRAGRAGGFRGARMLKVEDLEIDTAARSVAVAGVPVRLCRREYELLLELATEPKRVFTKRDLLSAVWGFRAEGITRTLDSHACRLRRKLAIGGRDYVINVWGVGYSLTRPASRSHSAGTIARAAIAPAAIER
jgi:DNA-binding response OmpR family regulator